MKIIEEIDVSDSGRYYDRETELKYIKYVKKFVKGCKAGSPLGLCNELLRYQVKISSDMIYYNRIDRWIKDMRGRFESYSETESCFWRYIISGLNIKVRGEDKERILERYVKFLQDRIKDYN